MAKEIKITIQPNEQELMESLLNMKYSGVNNNYLVFVLGLTAMEKQWNIHKLNYYLNLLEVRKYY